MQQRKFTRAGVAGLIGTAVMTMMILMAPIMGMPEMNIAAMLANFMNAPVAVGWIAHLMIGAIWAIVYTYFFVGKLLGAPWLRGVLFSLGPWLLMQTMASPMMGMGVFFSNSSAPMMMMLGTLMGHLVYGVVMGAVYGKGDLQKQVNVTNN